MSFLRQKAIHYLANQFQYYLFIRCIKASVVLKHQQFEDNKGDKTEPRGLKYWCHMDVYNNEKEQGLDGSKNEGNRYVLLLFVAFHPSLKK